MIQDFLNEYIHGDRFADIAHYQVSEDGKCDPYKMMDSNKILYCTTHYALKLFDVLRHSKNKYILITHNSDENVTENLYARKPENIKHWFSQNVLIKKHDLTPIPIGIERKDKGISWDMTKLQDINKKFWSGNKAKINKAFMAFNIRTNAKERLPLVTELGHVSHVVFRKNRLDFYDYTEQVSKHLFVICPVGNGTDTIRLWECLYLDTNTYPIVKRNTGIDSFSDLPICYVNNWSDVTKQFIIEKYNEIKRTKHNYDKLKMSYWRGRILNEYKHLC